MLDVKKLLSKLLAYQKDQVRVMNLGTTWVSSTGQVSWSISYTLPTGYSPLWAWCYSSGAVRATYVSEIRQNTNTVVGWIGSGTACNVAVMLLIARTE